MLNNNLANVTLCCKLNFENVIIVKICHKLKLAKSNTPQMLPLDDFPKRYQNEVNIF